LLARDPEGRPDPINCVDQVEVEEIRAALERYDQISAFFYAPPEPPPLHELRKAINHAWLTYQHAKYGMLARTLPRLLREAQAADATFAGSGGQGEEAAHLLGQGDQTSSAALRKLGEQELAWLAADGAMAVTQRAGDQLLAGTASCRVALALRALGRARPALEINVNIAARVAPGVDGHEATPERLSVYGGL